MNLTTAVKIIAWRCLLSLMFSRFSTRTPTCDRQTQADSVYRASIASHVNSGKKKASRPGVTENARPENAGLENDGPC